MEQKLIIGGVGLLIVAAIAIFIFAPKDNITGTVPSGKYDAFAQCIKDSGATFYGAFWCPHCAAQKALFGDSVKLLPYHECSTPDGNSQLADCTAAGVKQYPTWVFADHSTSTGEVPLATLAEKTGCTLPN
jgi:hypothetical protein